jgi:hypothetical protein
MSRAFLMSRSEFKGKVKCGENWNAGKEPGFLVSAVQRFGARTYLVAFRDFGFVSRK